MSPLPTERLKAAYLAAAELVQRNGEQYQLLMDCWQRKYTDRMRSKTALLRARALVAELEAELSGKKR